MVCDLFVCGVLYSLFLCVMCCFQVSYINFDMFYLLDAKSEYGVLKELKDKWRIKAKAYKAEGEAAKQKKIKWKNRYNSSFKETNGFDFFDVESDYAQPEELRMDNWKSYVFNMCVKLPILYTVLKLFIPPAHEKNTKSTKKHPKWKMWSDLYKSWIIDMFLRARAPKSVQRTVLLISAYLLLGNISETCWRFLQRFRIVATRETVERWIGMHKKVLKSTSSVLFYVFDNCNFHLHVTRVRSTHRSSFLNLITRFIVEIPQVIDVAASEVWKNMFSREDFGNWLQSNSDESIDWANRNWRIFVARPADLPLKFLYTGTESKVDKCDFTILEPLFNLETLKYEHIDVVLDGFCEEHIQSTDRTFAFVCGDQQVQFYSEVK